MTAEEMFRHIHDACLSAREAVHAKRNRELTIGEYVVDRWAMLDGTGGFMIAPHCPISAGVQFYRYDSWAIAGGKDRIEVTPTCIGNNYCIEPNVITAKSITISTKALGSMTRVIGTFYKNCVVY